LVEAKHPQLPITRQCKILEIARSTLYYRPKGESEKNLLLMRRIDEIYTECPFYGSRQMVRALAREGETVNRKRVRRLLGLMGLEALCPKPNLSKPTPGHRVFPYLMRGIAVQRPNQAWCADITYIRLERGFTYLFAILDWHSRKVLSWELSNTLDAAFCVRALRQAIETYGPPEVMNTDQGCQFTGEAWLSVLEQHGVRISMDGRGRALDNVFVERLWRTVKHEEIYRREYESVAVLRQCLTAYFDFYNHRRPHSALGKLTPAQAHQVKTDVA
jgi:putative transposase